MNDVNPPPQEPTPEAGTPPEHRAADRRRRSSLVLSTIALGAMASLLLWLGVILLTVHGVAQMVAIVPIFAFLGTSWIWALLSTWALVLAVRSPRRRLPLTLAVTGLVLAVVGGTVVFFVSVPF